MDGDSNKRGRETEAGSDNGNAKKRQQQDDHDDKSSGGGSNEDGANTATVHEQIIMALKDQNETLKTQNELLRSIDGRLGRIEQASQQGHDALLTGRQYQRGSRQHQHDSKVVHGTCKFVESNEAKNRRQDHQRRLDAFEEAKQSNRWLDTTEFNGAYGRVDDDGNILTGEEYPTRDSRGSIKHDFVSHQGDFSEVPWTSTTIRTLLPQLSFKETTKVPNESGIYALTIKYNNQAPISDKSSEAGIIIGEVEFNNKGYVMAMGADWDRLLTGQRQVQLPYSHGARGEPKWKSCKISEPWEDGVELKFRIDTNQNTIVFQKGNTPKKTLRNILAFTNNREYPEYLRVFAYCGGMLPKVQLRLFGTTTTKTTSKASITAKLTIIQGNGTTGL